MLKSWPFFFFSILPLSLSPSFSIVFYTKLYFPMYTLCMPANACPEIFNKFPQLSKINTTSAVQLAAEVYSDVWDFGRKSRWGSKWEAEAHATFTKKRWGSLGFLVKKILQLVKIIILQIFGTSSISILERKNLLTYLKHFCTLKACLIDFFIKN